MSTVGIEKIKEVSEQDRDINLNYGHYKPLAELINKYDLHHGFEIGCAYGNLAVHLMENTNLILHSIDPYQAYPDMPCIQTQEDYDLLYGLVKSKLSIYSRHELLRYTSEEFVEYYFEKYYGEHQIDFVFLDGLHTEEMVKWEIENYSKWIAPGGILSGHDYNHEPGVTKAVNEYAKASGKKLFTLPGMIWYFEM